MKLLLDSLWRAALYCLHPRVLLLALLPLVIAGVGTLGLSYLFWESAVSAVRGTLERWSLVAAVLQWLSQVMGANFSVVVAPLIVVVLAIPFVVALTLVLVALCVGPVAVEIVARRRFPQLERRQGGAWWQSLAWSLGCSLLALVILMATLPLWFIPLVAFVLPPLVWGWLTAQVMGFDALSEHASKDERRAILRAHRLPLLVAGTVSGLLCGLPMLLWVSSVPLLIYAPYVTVVAVWLYTIIFTFSALWFTHYGLAVLQRLRDAEAALRTPVPPPVEAASSPSWPGAPA